MVGFLPHFDTLHTFTTYYDSALLRIKWKITIILPQNFWNNIHHDIIYIYDVGIKTMFRKLPHRRDVPAGSTPRAPSSAFSRTALKPGTEGKSQEKTWVTIEYHRCEKSKISRSGNDLWYIFHIYMLVHPNLHPMSSSKIISLAPLSFGFQLEFRGWNSCESPHWLLKQIYV